MTTTAQPSFTPADEWELIDTADSLTIRAGAAYFSPPYQPPYGRGECPRQQADARLIVAAARLYAYAKAEALRNEWLDVRHGGGTTDEAVDALGKFEHQLTLMGWQRGYSSAPFLANYRYAALALAEGGGNE